MSIPVYQGSKTRAISFPLGGIGTGCVGLGGNGQLCDWEIRNRPNKGSLNGFSHFAVKVEDSGRVIDTRVLVGDLPGPYEGGGATEYSGFGFGVPRGTMQGFPHFRRHAFTGRFPFASVRFRDPGFPGTADLEAFNPFIPLDERNSSIPAAFFTVTLANTTRCALTYTVACSAQNPHRRRTVHSFRRTGDASCLTLASREWKPDRPEYGELTLATDAPDVSFQEYWYRGAGWFNNVGIYWQDLTAAGPLKNRRYRPAGSGDRVEHDDHGTLAARVSLKPGQRVAVRFVIAWHFPNAVNYWNPGTGKAAAGGGRAWRNYYATLFPDAGASARYALRNFDALRRDTRLFTDALLSSTVPEAVREAVSANLSILKSPTVLRLTDGSLYGFEGCSCGSGCCEGSCTHVWNYQYALPFLFPSLERSLRNLDYRYNQRPDGKMGFRLQLPVGRKYQDWHACPDGQFGGVIKVYRDWKISGDDAWLRSLWPAVKKSLEFAWARTNEDAWDADRDGVLEGRQHHTLDTELFGPNAYLTGFYLAALKAAAEIAEHFGEAGTARAYRGLFDRGRRWVERNLFNGHYYVQRINLRDRRVLTRYRKHDGKFGSVEAAYWDAEHGEIKNQIGDGCHCDQVIAQWHANLCGLGDIFDRGQVRSALRSIYRHNFKKSLRDHVNPCRIFALNDEAALIICVWPDGRKPAVPLTYAEEAMNGFEYQVAAHLIQEGMVAEGVEIVRAIRDRYDGEKRNPWNEFECGSNYARSLASFSLLPALAGFSFDLVHGHIGFAPRTEKRRAVFFWSLEGAWGTYRRTNGAIVLRVIRGTLSLNSFGDSLLAGHRSVRVNSRACGIVGDRVVFPRAVTVTAGRSLRITVSGR